MASALARGVVLRGLRVAAVVGTLIALINYGDRLAAGVMSGRDWLKLVLTYAVPYAVATYSSVSALRDRG
ncbi:MAG: nitrate/nitrite transporter NrtS [Gammaproteobacteria bacterium]|nr:nitrate/nitrite transporter NrtS [Gammaproteobacteria bacterium]MBI5616413.1 nitrate/nitrite transporter NrtS [Gammaproteobacteria bacterium]